MKDMLTVMKFTMKEMIKSKSFIIATCIMLVLVIVGVNIPNILDAVNGSDDEITKVLIVDDTGVFEGNLAKINNMKLGYEFEIINNKVEFKDVQHKVDKQEVDGAILIDKLNKQVNVTCLMKDTSSEYILKECVDALKSLYSDLKISKLEFTNEQLEALYPEFEVKLQQLEEESDSNSNTSGVGNTIACMIISIMLFYVVYFCAYQVSGSITTEKTSKIIETLVTSATPETIVWGKTIGIGLVGLLQLGTILSTAIIGASVFLKKEFLEGFLGTFKVTPFVLVVTIMYFILGYLAYALMYALTGSMVSRPEDAQTANTPVATIAMIGFYLSYFTSLSENGLSKIAGILPISSPFCMPTRIVTGLASGKDVAISMAILVASIVVIAHIAIKVYSNAILNYGTKMSVKNIVALYKN